MFDPAIIFLGLAMVIVAFECARVHAAPFDFLFLFNISFLIYFALGPAQLLMGGEEYTSIRSIYMEHISPVELWSEMKIAVLILVGYALVILGYYSKFAKALGSRVHFVAPSRKRIIGIMIFLFLIGLASLFVYSRQYDGLMEVILGGVLIRAGITKATGDLLFLKHFIPLINVAELLLLCLILSARSRLNRIFLSQLFFVGIALVLIVVFVQGSRRSLIIFCATAYLIVANYTGRRHIGVLASLAILFLSGLLLGDKLFLAVSGTGDSLSSRLTEMGMGGLDWLYILLWRDFTLPFMEFVGVFFRFEGSPRWFIDFPLGFLEIAPSQVMPLDLGSPLIEKSTLLLMRQPLDTIAGVPPGFFGFMWYSGLIAGLVAGSYCFGWVGGFLESALRIRSGSHPVQVIAYVFVGFAWAYSLRTGIPGMILNDRFHWILGLLLLFGAGQVFIVKKQR